MYGNEAKLFQCRKALGKEWKKGLEFDTQENQMEWNHG